MTVECMIITEKKYILGLKFNFSIYSAIFLTLISSNLCMLGVKLNKINILMMTVYLKGVFFSYDIESINYNFQGL